MSIRVLMICSVFPAEVGPLFHRDSDVGGGWITGNIEGMKNYSDIELSYVVFSQSRESRINNVEKDGISYFLVQYNSAEIIKNFFSSNNQDIVHLYGAEHKYIPDILPFLPFEKTLVYIQGIQSEYYWHYQANIDQYHRTGTLFDKYIELNRSILKKQADAELEVFRNARFINGRTSWDRAFLFKNHCTGTYFSLNETLRPIFYSAEKWDSKNMHRHTIFVTQAGYPIKACHMILEIIKILKSYYPDVKCYIGGEDLAHAQSAATSLHVSYASHIQKLIKEYKLEENIEFCGFLSAEEVVRHLTACNAFLLSSSIENSPNSLQEAMLMGVPSVSSYVGGVKDLADNSQVLQYPFDDPMAGAYALSEIFESDELAQTLSKNAQNRAKVLTDPAINAEQLHEIYIEMSKMVNA